MSRVVIFGIQDFASLAHFYLRHDSPHEPVAFTVTEEYLPANRTFEGLPVVPFEELSRHYPPDDFDFFAPMSHRKMNRLREEIYRRARASGYACISYVSSRATVFPGTPIGENCFVLEDNTIQPFTRIGDNVVLWSGNHIGHHSVVGDHVMFTSHVVLSGHCEVGAYSFLGVNATVRDRIKVADGTLVAMAASITHDTEPWGVYRGDPARKAGVLSSEMDF
jgi:sugar O-acyltransferase (sialic acid O-acetyltransferase NeuD family)